MDEILKTPCLQDLFGAKKNYKAPHIKTLGLDCDDDVCGVETSLGSGTVDIGGGGGLSKDNVPETGNNDIWEE
ncbi:MAG: hypothetical protein LKG25_01930 [Prevotella sp.]|jgi:hypothetical protein|nr:hypothetical protein [Prevotella sp.]MCI1281338.1 hypothetical protein [Prevotella sp.]